jgi:hypothetical protein
LSGTDKERACTRHGDCSESGKAEATDARAAAALRPRTEFLNPTGFRRAAPSVDLAGLSSRISREMSSALDLCARFARIEGGIAQLRLRQAYPGTGVPGFDRRRPFAPSLSHRRQSDDRPDAHRSLRSELAEAPAEAAVGLGGLEQPLPRLRPVPPPVVAAPAPALARQRAVIVLWHLLEYTPAEIAELFKLSGRIVNPRLRRGLDLLADTLEHEALA